MKVQEDPNNSNYTIASANKNHAGTYRCVAVVTAPGLAINPAEYTFDVTVRCKSTNGLLLLKLICMHDTL